MRDKGINVFDECTARCAHLDDVFPQEEERTSASFGDYKTYTSDGIASSQGMLTEI